MTTDPHRPLRDDVRLLGKLLGQVLRSQEGEELFEAVERVRAAAKHARQDAPGNGVALEDLIRDVPVEHALTVARAFAHFLTLANIAEQHHRIRRRRHYQRDANAAPQRASFGDSFASLLAHGMTHDALHAAVCSLDIELVLTAHPTEVVRRTLVQKQQRIAERLAFLDRNDLTVPERSGAIDALSREITAAWWTDEVQRKRPTPLDEVRWGLVVFERTLWDAVPRYLRQLDGALRDATGKPLPRGITPIRFGSWMGGDRDGNPNVTPAVTERACLLARWMAADLYGREVSELRAELSLREGSGELRQRVGAAAEPYRALLRDVRDRLLTTRRGIERLLKGEPLASGEQERMYWRAAELAEPIELCYRSLVETGVTVIAEGRVLDLLRRLACFGITLVRLDIRQEADRHTEALDALTRALNLGAYADWQEADRQAFLIRQLGERAEVVADGLAPRSAFSDRVEDVFATFRTAATLSGDALGAYVISMARTPSDVLAVLLLQVAAGVDPPLRVVPLFETVSDLRGAEACLRTLLSVLEYRAHIGDRQEIMIGYSDSAKDGGRLAAAWELYLAQERIVTACQEAGVHPTLFHGRGGTVGRGGGPTHLAIQSQPPGSVRGSLRVTEQGEMINSKFGFPEIAVRTLELYTTATLSATLQPAHEPSRNWRERMQVMADTSRAAFRRTVYDTPAFVEYFRAATPERELGALKIGSRPSRRRPGKGVESLRAIPWVFAWTQTRLMLPAWLGVGEALEQAMTDGALDELTEMYREWPFFRSTLDLIEMVLAKASPGISERYDAQLVPETLQHVGRDLRARLRQTIAAVLRVTGHRVLVEDNPVLRRSIDVRNPYVDPINLVQAEILTQLRASPTSERLQDALLVTVNGIAAGMRNTG